MISEVLQLLGAERKSADDSAAEILEFEKRIANVRISTDECVHNIDTFYLGEAGVPISNFVLKIRNVLHFYTCRRRLRGSQAPLGSGEMGTPFRLPGLSRWPIQDHRETGVIQVACP